MIYTFECIACKRQEDVQRSMADAPVPIPCSCGKPMQRVWKMPQIVTRGDPDEIPQKHQVCDRHMNGIGKAAAKKKERLYTAAIEERRRVLRDHRDPRSSMQHTHSVPAELYHGKIKQTGDKHYWNDPKNLERHTSCKVS